MVVAKFANTTQHGAIEGKTQTRDKEYFNLEMITSVGYRVKSQRGVQFRQWANQVLKDYLLKGYAINDRIRKTQIKELRQLVQMVGRTIQNQPLLKTDENQALFDIVVDYTYALDTLDDYDYQRLGLKETTQEEKFQATYENAMQAIATLREKFGGSTLFGNEKDDSFKSSIGQIYQTFDRKDRIQALRKRLPCCFISSRRTTHLLMATSELPLQYFCGFSTITASFIARMAVSALPTIP
jgi:hypothetical protein